MAKKLTVYQRLARAAKRGGCLRLSANDVWQLGRMDEAITSRAEQDDEEDETTRLENEVAGRKFLADSQADGGSEHG